MVDVVDLADFFVGGAADAAAVADDEAFAEPLGDLALRTAQQDIAGVFVEDARQDFGVAGHSQRLLFGEAGAVGQAGVGDLLVDEVVVG